MSVLSVLSAVIVISGLVIQCPIGPQNPYRGLLVSYKNMVLNLLRHHHHDKYICQRERERERERESEKQREKERQRKRVRYRDREREIDRGRDIGYTMQLAHK